MSSRKTERQLDLLFILLNATRPLSRESIRQKIAEYREQENAEAFERMFERDKDDLRSIGVPIETKSLSQLFEDEYGYAVDIRDFGYSKISFDPNELSELTRAALVWQDSVLSSNARLGLVKSATKTNNQLDFQQEFDVSEIISDHVYLRITEAVTHEKVIIFNYIKPSEKNASTKRVFPYELNARGQFIYILGLDLSDKIQKTFNLSRFIGELEIIDPSPVELKEFQKLRNERPRNQQVSTAHIEPLVDPVVIQHLLGGEIEQGRLLINYYNEESFAIFLAPYCNLMKSIEPISLKKLVVDQLTSLDEKLA
jgi:predicted DNA-binding transcriptional regulator YafY